MYTNYENDSNCSDDDVFLDDNFAAHNYDYKKFRMSKDVKASPSAMPTAPPKFAVITVNRDARRASIFEHAPINLALMSKGSSTLSCVQEPSGNCISTVTEEDNVQYENTYKTGPDVKFPYDTVKEMMLDHLTERLKGVSYDRPTSIRMAKNMSQEIKIKIKELVKRYKIVTMVTIGEQKEQDVRMGSRCVWDVDRDCFASVYYENNELFAVAIAYALYYE